MATELVHAAFNAKVWDSEQVYDGDTLERVEFRIPGVMPEEGVVNREVLPDLFIRESGLWARVNVRLKGIDTPERHPHHFYSDGTPRASEEVDYEKHIALAARDEVVSLLELNGFNFELRNPEIGKYAGRLVCDVWLYNGERHYINLSSHLIKAGLAVPYDGGKKIIWRQEDA